MTDVDRLFQEYKAKRRAGGGADPHAYLERVEGTDRAELTALIDAYLERAPRVAWNPEAYAASAAAPLVEALTKSLRGQAGLWPSLLPRLRDRARIKRADLVAELADRLGAAGQREKVGSYYHQMEQGLLPASGVADEVLDALGKIVGTTREALRHAGESLGAGPAADGPAEVFARSAQGGEDAEAERLAPASPGAPAEPLDDVDRLFRSG